LSTLKWGKNRLGPVGSRSLVSTLISHGVQLVICEFQARCQ